MKGRFTAIYFLGMIVEIIVRAPYERRRKQIQKIDWRVSLAERGLLTWITVGMCALPLAYGLSKRLDFANYRLAPATEKIVGGVGAVLLGAAAWMLWRGHRDLGANWSPSLEITTRQTFPRYFPILPVRACPIAMGCDAGAAYSLLAHSFPQAAAIPIPLQVVSMAPRSARCLLHANGDIAPTTLHARA